MCLVPLKKYVNFLLFRQVVKTLAMGQGLAGLICGTAISSQYLATSFHVNTPMLQSLLNYTLLCITYTTMLVFRTGHTTTQKQNIKHLNHNIFKWCFA